MSQVVKIKCRQMGCGLRYQIRDGFAGQACPSCGWTTFVYDPPLPPPLSEQVAKLEAEIKSFKATHLIDDGSVVYWHDQCQKARETGTSLEVKLEGQAIRIAELLTENSDLRTLANDLKEKVQEQHDTIEYNAIGYYAGANAKTWHDSFIKERTESEKLVVQLDKAKRGEYWLGETAKHWYEKYDFMCEALKRLV